VPYLIAPPNPQIAAGPDDILTIVNRTISRYPNPNAAGNTGTLNPYNYPATEYVPLDVWMGLTVLGTQAGGGALCPSGTGNNSNCVIDNASIRYDQMEGRFLVLFTVTDMPAHRSNWVLVVSTFSQFQKCTTPPTGVCPSNSPLFTPPVIAPIVGGTQTGGQNPANWVLYKIPINLLYNAFQQPSALGLVNNPAAVAPFNSPLANSAVGTPITITTGGSSATFLNVPFCPNGGPTLPLTYATVNGQPLGAGGTGRTCTNYFPTGARFGTDNDNVILTAPVLHQAFAPNEGNFPSGVGQNQGPYAGTRVTTIPKFVIYNGINLVLDQPAVCLPAGCQAINLADNTATGTLSAVTQTIAFGQGTAAVLGVSKAGDLQYGAGSPNTPNSCVTANPVAVPPTPLPANPPVLSCAPIAALPTALKAIFWEPDNLRGRSLASFDAQVAPFGTPQQGAITPYDYIVGTEITDNFGAGIVPQGVPGVTGQPGAVPGTTVPATAGVATKYYLQSIAFSCPGTSGLISDFTNCFSGAPGAQLLVADLPLFGTLRTNFSTLAQVADPSPVGQGFSATQMTTNPLNTPVSPTINNRIFVGDSRPEQVMFREGLLYIARSVRLADLQINWLGTSTVLYDIVKTCATAAPLPACGGFSITGANIGNANVAFEYEWFNGTSIPDPGGNINGFGFYQPMFESPADVVSTGPISPISTLQLFDKLFVGMTTGGTNNTAAIFAKNFPSLWDFRPGDDAFDTIEPYLDPYTGLVRGTYQCGGDVTVSVLSRSGNTITVADTTGLAVGMFQTGTQLTIQSIAGNVVTLSAAFGSSGTTFPTNATFTRNQPNISVIATLVTPGSNQITVNSATGLAIGQAFNTGTPVVTAVNPGTLPAGCNGGATCTNAGVSTGASGTPVGNVSTTAFTCLVQGTVAAPVPGCNVAGIASTTTFGIRSLTNVGLSEAVIGARTGNVSALSGTTTGSTQITIPNTAQVAIGEQVTGTGISQHISGPPDNGQANTFVTGITVNLDNTLQITLSVPEVSTNPGPTNVVFDSTPCFGPFNVNPGAGVQRVTATTNASLFVVGGVNIPGVSYNGTLGCTSFYADSTGSNAGQAGPINSLNGAIIDNGIPSVFLASSLFGGGTTIINIVGNTVTLSNSASAPLPGQGAGVTSTNLPFNFATAGTSAAVTCPIIPFSSRGGASTDPNDGSLWLFGEFAKNRLSTIPGPGQWGTSVANYALSFPATDAYGNDNTYFQDVQPTGSADSGFFTWIQLAKNLGLAVPAATGPCTINNGLPPILQPPAPGTLPVPSPSTLGCPYFGPDTIVTRAEMAYWVVKAFMDDTMVANYLCATGGDPSGRTTCPGSVGLPGSTFADLGAGGGSILNPFLGANPGLGIVGVTNAQLMQYIEVMARRRITLGCNNTNDPQAAYCPNQPVTRAQMAVFLIRAKMNNVFPTTLSGTPGPFPGPLGDNFGTFTPSVPYFSDVTAADPVFGAYFPFIQKMRELRITNGTGGVTYSPGNNLTRKEIAVFIVRAFFL